MIPLIPLKAIPWRLIGVGALVAAGAVAAWWIPHHFREQGREEVRAQWKAANERDALEAGKRKLAVMERNQEKSDAVQSASIATESTLRKELQNAQTARSKLVDDLVAGRLRIRPFDGAGGNAGVQTPAAACLGDREAAGLRERVAQTVAIGTECTAEVTALRRELVDRTAAVNERQ